MNSLYYKEQSLNPRRITIYSLKIIKMLKWTLKWLRSWNIFIEGINLGGQEEEIYEKTDKHRIARAFKIYQIK
ncbi:MAG: hypothetical protein ACOC4G_15045 [Bacillota bacterium]